MNADKHSKTENPAAALADSLRDLAANEAELAKLAVVDSASGIGARLVAALIFAVFGAGLFVAVNVAAGLWLSRYLSGYAAGFGALAGIYAVVIALLFACRRPVIYTPVRNLITRKLTDDASNDTQHDETAQRS